MGKSVGHFRANSKALAEVEADGIAKVLYNKNTEEVLGVHIIGIHAADLIQECANAVAGGTTVRELAMMVSGGARIGRRRRSISAYDVEFLLSSLSKLFVGTSTLGVRSTCLTDIFEFVHYAMNSSYCFLIADRCILIPHSAKYSMLHSKAQLEWQLISGYARYLSRPPPTPYDAYNLLTC